jgi:hypothetical protein
LLLADDNPQRKFSWLQVIEVFAREHEPVNVITWQRDLNVAEQQSADLAQNIRRTSW